MPVQAAPVSRRRLLWGEAWRYAAAAAAGGLLLLAVRTDPDAEWRARAGLEWLDALEPVLGVVGVALLHWRRRWPLAIALATCALTIGSVAAIGAAGIALISLATHRRWSDALAGGAAWLATGLAYQSLRPTSSTSSWVSNLVTSVLALAVCLALGFYIGARRDLLASLRERAETAEREQVLRVAQARATERTRIAREMHDVLAHRISLVAMQSGALAYRTDLTREETNEAASVIRDNAHQALGELREVLGLLRDLGESDASARRPQPTLSDLDDLVSETRAAGVEVRLDMAVGDPSDIPVGVSRHGYRILQEALTNARKHASGEGVHLDVQGHEGEGLRIVARNGIPRERVGESMPASGMGLTGLTERAVLSGGELSYGTDRRGDFVLTAWLPWTT